MIPGDVDEVVCGIVENLIIALEARAEHYDDNLPKKASRRSIVEVRTHFSEPKLY